MTFVGPYIVTYFYSKTNKIHNISNLFYFGATLYMFRMVSPSIISSLRLYIQHQVYVIQVLWLLARSHRACIVWCCMYSLRLLMIDGQNVRNMWILFVFGATAPQWARASSFTRFLDHTQRRTTIGRTSLDEWSARRRDLYLTTHKTHNRQTSMPPLGFEPTISAGERPLGPAVSQIIVKISVTVTTDILTTICNARSRNIPNTDNCTYEPLWRLAWTWLCIRAETCSYKYN